MRTNFDVYKKELELLQCGTEFGIDKTNQNPRSCDRMGCSNCLFNKLGYSCSQCRLKWLGTEYKKIITLNPEEKALLEKIDLAFYPFVKRKGSNLFFGNSHVWEPKNYIALHLFKKALFFISLEEEKIYSIKELLNGEK